MPTERCARLMAVSMANKLDEVWISEYPSLLNIYLNQYFPNLFRWYVCLVVHVVFCQNCSLWSSLKFIEFSIEIYHYWFELKWNWIYLQACKVRCVSFNTYVAFPPPSISFPSLFFFSSFPPHFPFPPSPFLYFPSLSFCFSYPPLHLFSNPLSAFLLFIFPPPSPPPLSPFPLRPLLPLVADW